VRTGHLADALGLLREVLGCFDLLVLGRGFGVFYEEKTKRVDLEKTDRQLGSIQESIGGLKIWLEPGDEFLTPCGALLIPVEGAAQSRDLLKNISIQKAFAVRHETGDILLAPHFNLHSFLRAKGGSSRSRIRECYLNARRICQVPI
jgi:hypothetical protein